MKELTAILIIIFIAWSNLAGQKGIPVYVNGNAEDMVGQSLVYKIKEEFRKSKSFDLKLTDDGDVKFVVDIATMDRHKGDPEYENMSTIYIILFLFDNGKEGTGFRYNYITQRLGFVGRDSIESSATNKVAQALEIFSGVIDWIKGNN